MAKIRQLDQPTIDMIAAGEVVERPVSVVKELVENALDAGARAITVEIRQGGIDLIRVTDDGEGIAAEDVRHAFLPHATSKITQIEDLFTIDTLGFRGEALSSIAAVSRVHMVTATATALSATSITIHGGVEEEFTDIGAPKGTTIVVRDLFYNTPARRKFLKRPQTEAAYITDLVERIALAFPDVSFRLIRDKKDRLTTSGSGDYRELIYRIFGREVETQVNPLFFERDGMTLTGYLGEPSLNRSNRNYEIFFVNGRLVRDKVLSGALEEGYDEYLMQHKFPFAILMLTMPQDAVDVNAHPQKREVRFHEESVVYALVRDAVHGALSAREMIPEVHTRDEAEDDDRLIEDMPEPFEEARRGGGTQPVRLADSPVFKKIFPEGVPEELSANLTRADATHPPQKEPSPRPIIKQDRQVYVEKDVQMNLFDVRMLMEENKPEYRILGQVFDTYWILAFRDKMYLVDQHAAHEKVNYERMMKRFHDHDMMSQLLQPPLVLTLSAPEEALFQRYESAFRDLGFQVEPFGAHAYAMRAVPLDLYGAGEKELFLSILDELSEEKNAPGDPSLITQRIATMACKASVKGNTAMTEQEMAALIDELLTLDNPYNCPHGRPTIISMSKMELDRRFKRIV